jgi:histidine phosphatase superfamily protein (branch 1)
MRQRVLVAFLIYIIFAPPLAIEAQQAIFLLRHAEQVPDVEEPPLTEVGQRRARTLAKMFKDAGINAIYTNLRLRSIQTAEPLAKALNVESKALPASRDDVDGLIRALRTHPRDRVLIVTGSLNIPHILKALGHPVEVTIPPFEYDNVFVIFPRDQGAPVVLHLRYESGLK